MSRRLQRERPNPGRTRPSVSRVFGHCRQNSANNFSNITFQTAYLKEVRGARAPRALSKVEYSVMFNVNSNQLSTIAKKLSREAQSDTTAKKLLAKGIFIKAKQDKVTISTVEDYVGEPSATAYVAKVDEELADLYVFTFKVSLEKFRSQRPYVTSSMNLALSWLLQCG